MEKIAVIGIGYVGKALSIMLGKSNDVYVFDIDENKYRFIKENTSKISDENIANFVKENFKNIHPVSSLKSAVENAKYLFISTPTDYDENTHYFNCNSVTNTIKESIKLNPNIIIVIKSTLPIGYCDEITSNLNYDKIFFVPEFLKEGDALKDSLIPSRIIVGIPKNNEKYMQIAHEIANILAKCALKENIPTLIISNKEAEASKLFANAYLAMRVSFFNELDSYSMANNISSKAIIDAISLDPRIGAFYNNPSFGFGGYCLPKDSKQLSASFGDVPNSEISAIITANKLRKKFIADTIKNKLKNKPNSCIGIYRLSMKKDSDNFRQSSIIDVINLLKESDIKMCIYEPSLNDEYFNEVPLEKDLQKFKEKSDLIVANRYDDELSDVIDKLFTRDIYKIN